MPRSKSKGRKSSKSPKPKKVNKSPKPKKVKEQKTKEKTKKKRFNAKAKTLHKYINKEIVEEFEARCAKYKGKLDVVPAEYNEQSPLLNIALFSLAGLYVVGVLIAGFSKLLILSLCGLALCYLCLHEVPMMLLFPAYYDSGDYEKMELSQNLTGWGGKLYKLTKNNPKEDMGLDYQDVEIRLSKDEVCKSLGKTSRKDYCIRGWHVFSENDVRDTCVVAIHGAGRDRRAFARHIPFIKKAGFGCLLVDCRGHGLSPPAKSGTTFGIREPFDIYKACKYAKTTLGYQNVVILSLSQGAFSSIVSTATMRSSADKASFVDGLICEGGFHNRKALTLHILKTHTSALPFPLNYVQELVMNFAWFGLDQILDQDTTDPFQENADRVVHLIDIPVLFIHGTADSTCPISGAEKLFDLATEPKDIWRANGAEHTAVYDVYPVEFAQRVVKFVNKCCED
eukprot:g1463.t1